MPPSCFSRSSDSGSRWLSDSGSPDSDKGKTTTKNGGNVCENVGPSSCRERGAWDFLLIERRERGPPFTSTCEIADGAEVHPCTRIVENSVDVIVLEIAKSTKGTQPGTLGVRGDRGRGGDATWGRVFCSKRSCRQNMPLSLVSRASMIDAKQQVESCKVNRRGYYMYLLAYSMGGNITKFSAYLYTR